MSTFNLAGLLRLRHLQQDLAAGELSAARARLDETGMQQQRARAALGSGATDVTSTEHLYAIAAGRASLRSTLSDLDALCAEQQLVANDAGAAFGAARTKSVTLEKLERKHAERVTAQELAAEQLVLDELATTTWHRSSEGSES